MYPVCECLLIPPRLYVLVDEISIVHVANPPSSFIISWLREQYVVFSSLPSSISLTELAVHHPTEREAETKG